MEEEAEGGVRPPVSAPAARVAGGALCRAGAVDGVVVRSATGALVAVGGSVTVVGGAASGVGAAAAAAAHSPDVRLGEEGVCRLVDGEARHNRGPKHNNESSRHHEKARQKFSGRKQNSALQSSATF